MNFKEGNWTTGENILTPHLCIKGTSGSCTDDTYEDVEKLRARNEQLKEEKERLKFRYDTLVTLVGIAWYVKLCKLNELCRML